MTALLPSGRLQESEPYIAEYDEATESRLTLYALRDALQRMNYACEIIVHTECGYLRTVTDNRWPEEWEQNGWKNKRGEDVKDAVLWCDIYRMLEEDGHVLRVEAGRHEYSGWMQWQMPIKDAYKGVFREMKKKEFTL